MNLCACGQPVFIKKTSECRRCYNARYYSEHHVPSTWVPPVMTYEKLLATPCSYQTAHKRVRDRRGGANDHLCLTCGETASEWAYRGGSPYEITGTVTKGHKRMTTSWSTDINAYDPMCQQCHAERDGHPYRTGIRHDPIKRMAYLDRQRERRASSTRRLAQW